MDWGGYLGMLSVNFDPVVSQIVRSGPPALIRSFARSLLPLPPRRVLILGSTGSIGVQTLDVVRHVNALAASGEGDISFRVVGLAAGGNAELLARQAAEFAVPTLALARGACDVPGVRCLSGPDAAEELVRSVECDLVVAAMVGFAGLPATLVAVELGRDIALANKETLVAAGALMTEAARASGAKLLPVDSEHAAAWQCVLALLAQEVCRQDACVHGATECVQRRWCPPFALGELPKQLRALTLTASGGALRTWSKARIASATPADALAHPTWRMGPKVTIDSATLMNKALEIVEAHWLFGLRAEQLHACVHPSSHVHAIAELADGTSIVQWAPADMRIPIQRALLWPHAARAEWSGDAAQHRRSGLTLEFSPPDAERFPAISLGHEVIKRGGNSGAVVNAVNEVAVAAFLEGRLAMPRIAELAHEALAVAPRHEVRSLADAQAADAWAREWARSCVGRGA